MINVFNRACSFKTGLVTLKSCIKPNIIRPNAINLKYFSAGYAICQQQRSEDTFKPKPQLPNLFYVQNPITWLINKIDFIMLRKAWDIDFMEEEFKHGVKQAVTIICTLISKNLWDNLRGLLANKALLRLQRDVQFNWTKEQRTSLAMETSDIKLVLPRKVHFLRIAEKKFVDIDVICVAMKFKDEEPSEKSDIILIEIFARFHRNYSCGEIPDWTVTLFKVSTQNEGWFGLSKMGLLALFGFEVVSLCSTYSIFIGGNIYSYRYLPKGDCRLCCPIQKDIDITFNLFTRNNPTLPQQLVIDDLWSIRESFLNPAHPTVFYVHGFTERAMGLSARTVKNAYLQKGDVNMIIVDWGSLCSFPYYAAAVKNTRVVGKYFAKFLEFLHNSHIIPIDAVHVIGFSLGAEVAGFTGKALGKNVLPRITGLDPAFPLYIFQGDIGHLAKTDAKFVDVIHTDGGVFGFPNPIGHVDFYPNGGIALQPGCRLSQLSRRGHPEEVVACSHNRAWGYYSESVNNEYAFPAFHCDDYDSFMRGNCSGLYSEPAYMGYIARPKHKGKYYLTTSDRPPFGFYP